MANGTNWSAKKNEYYKQWNKAKKQTQMQGGNTLRPPTKDSDKQASSITGKEFGRYKYQDARDFFGVGQPGSEYENWYSGLSNDEDRGVYRYTNGYYSAMNGPLREGVTPDSHVQGMIDGATAALAKANLSEDLIVWRGSSRKIFGGAKTVQEVQAMIGYTIKDKGFGSCAVTRDKAWPKDFVLKIKVPKGKGRGQYVDPMSAHSGEQEFIIQRGAAYRIVNAYRDNTYHENVVELEYLPGKSDKH